MIGKLKGTIDEIAEDYVVLDVHSVGYVPYSWPRTLGKLGTAVATREELAESLASHP